jgi:hypothetical protein
MPRSAPYKPQGKRAAQRRQPRHAPQLRRRYPPQAHKSTVATVAAALVAVALCGCGGSTTPSTSSKQSTSGSASSTSAGLGVCENPTQCRTQTTGQLLRDVKISDPSDVPAVVKTLEQTSRRGNEGTESGVALVDSLCAPVGATGRFPANTYMCGGVNRDSQGRSSYLPTQLFNVGSDGSVHYVGSPCLRSAPDSRCQTNYWTFIKQQQRRPG